MGEMPCISYGSIIHRSAFTDCYALNEDEIIIRIRTGKEISSIYLIYGDPYAAGISGRYPWKGKRFAMALEEELEYSFVWEARLMPQYKREQYYFEIACGEEIVYLLEDGFYGKEELEMFGRMKQYFKYPWINASDVIVPPSWVGDTVWYQIMPDRFLRGDSREKRHLLKDWGQADGMSYWDFYGGDLKGIKAKLGYLKHLGISGIYLTPVMESDTNHKYNVFNYAKIDADFGTEEDIKDLVVSAHDLGIRVMLDAVFNHCGTGFFAWKDVQEKGKDSPYYGWFYINRWQPDNYDSKTKDGRYYSFAFEADMPKLNTNNPEVASYLTEICKYWVKEWKIDGIRFDVGNEVSHTFIRKLNRELKSINSELFLLGEIWHDSIQWLMGGEYDSVMNYPFLESIHNFWLDKSWDSKKLMYSINRCYSMYCEQTNRILFQFLDTHDTCRAYTRCGRLDVFFQQLALLMTMQGTPCLYYGTEIAMEGGNNPFNRKCMPWKEIENGTYDKIIDEVRQLLAIRRHYPQAKSGRIIWKHDKENVRLVHYMKESNAAGQYIGVILNAGQNDVPIERCGDILYCRKYGNGLLVSGGTLIYKVLTV